MSTTTRIVISTTGQTYTAPGSLDLAQVRAMYGSSLPAVNTMDADITNEGDQRVITFRPKVGTKG